MVSPAITHCRHAWVVLNGEKMKAFLSPLPLPSLSGYDLRWMVRRFGLSDVPDLTSGISATYDLERTVDDTHKNMLSGINSWVPKL